MGCGVKKSCGVISKGVVVVPRFRFSAIVCGRSCKIARPGSWGWVSNSRARSWPRPPPMSTMNAAEGSVLAPLIRV